MPLSKEDVAMVVVCLAGILLAGIFAPAVVTIVYGVVTTLIGAFFVNRRGKTSTDDKSPALALVPKSSEKKEDAS